MADLTKLTADVADLTSKVEALMAKVAAATPPTLPVDDQPAVDALAATVEALSAKIVV